MSKPAKEPAKDPTPNPPSEDASPTAALAARTTRTGRPLTLYDAASAMLAVEQFIDEHQEEIIAAGGDLDAVHGLAEILERIEGTLAQRVEHVVLFIQERAALAAARREQSDRFRRLSDADTRTVESLKKYLVKCQRIANVLKVETPACRSSVQKNSAPSVSRNDEGATPLWALVGLAWDKVDPQHEVFVTGGTMPALLVLDHVPTATRAEFDGRLRQVARAESIPYSDEGEDLKDAADVVLDYVDIVPPTEATYRVHGDKVKDRWKRAYDRTVAQLATEMTPGPDGTLRPFTPYEVDTFAQAEANRDPVLLLLGVTIVQGYHVRLK